MGRESDASRNARVANVAEYERTVGPTLKFQSRHECPKCGTSMNRFKIAFCGGMSADWDANRRRHWIENNGCPVDGEHMHVVCAACEFGWHEFPKDDERNYKIEVVSP